MRQALVIVHRWVGLVAALFLFLAGLTGAIIAWDHELDALLNPELSVARTASDRPPTRAELLAVADRFEQLRPEAVVSYLPLRVEPGHTLSIFVQPRSATGAPMAEGEDTLGYDNVVLDPISGAVQGQRKWGEAALTRQALLPFLYRFHYTLHLPDVAAGVNVGVVLMGLIAILWVLDCFVALVLAFPNRAQWRKSFAFRFGAGGYRLVFDLHRSGGVWAWLLLLTIAITAVTMNFRREVMAPVVSLFSELSPDIWTERPKQLTGPRDLPTLDRVQAIALAEAEAQKRSINAPAGALFHTGLFGLYGVGFFEGYDAHGDGDLGPAWIYLDDQTGQALSAVIPGRGSAGDLFMQAQFPLHSGRLGGVWGRALVTLLGLAIAVLSGTGVVIWWKKRRARLSVRAKNRTTVVASEPRISTQETV